MLRSNRRYQEQLAPLVLSSVTRPCQISTLARRQIHSVIPSPIPLAMKINNFLQNRRNTYQRRQPPLRSPKDSYRVVALVCWIADPSLALKVFVGSRGQSVRLGGLHHRHFPIKTVTLVDQLTTYRLALLPRNLGVTAGTAEDSIHALTFVRGLLIIPLSLHFIGLCFSLHSPVKSTESGCLCETLS